MIRLFHIAILVDNYPIVPLMIFQIIVVFVIVQRNITFFRQQQKTARANGEINQKQVTRRNHGGKSVITEGVTSNKINEVKTKEYENNRKRWISE